ncbi:urease accessory protein UreD [Gracilibacillus sp. YIM 98692]|uniref:urease accessory protein UreD n=1 Tax=Gracilibacillus sp. YIM 98692 TaxID=2663532 RepID=UPI0013D4BCD9|nr:urease accessory protein UreD [Gracilibacillus sp. YIM 98692]
MLASKKVNSYGKLDLTFTARRGKTVMTDCYYQPPLRASRGLYVNGSKDLTVYLVETSGGLVAGDRNEFRIKVEDNAKVTLHPQSATKVYPSFNHHPSRQDVEIEVGEHGSLQWKREEVIPFEDAKYHANVSVQMKPSSTLWWEEILYPGREKRGESFVFSECHTHLNIWMEEDCLAYDSLKLSPDKQQLQTMGVMEQFQYIGSVWVVSPDLTDKEIESDVEELLTQQSDHQSSVTKLNGNGYLIRWLSNHLPLMKKEMEKLSEYMEFIS